MANARGRSRPGPRVAQALPIAEAVLQGVVGAAQSRRPARAGAAELLAEAREQLAYWEQRARSLPRWALGRRREARTLAARWRERVTEVERELYGRGVLGVASQMALERRAPATLAHRARRVGRAAAYAAVAGAITLALVAAAAIAMIVDAVAG